MYIVDGIAYAGQPMQDMEVVSVVPVGDEELLVRFSTGETRLFDGVQLRDYPAFAPLFENDAFDDPRVVDGILTWCDEEVDISSAKLYSMSYRYDVVA